MAPYELKQMILKQLRKAFLAMMSPQWDIALIGKPQEEITKAAQSLLTLQRIRLRLENKQLREIRDKLRENETALINGKKSLNKTLKNLKRVPDVMNAINSFLTIVSGIVDFID